MSVQINGMFVTVVWKVFADSNLRYERGSELSSGIPKTLLEITLKLDNKSKALTFGFTVHQKRIKDNVSLPVSDIGKLKEDANDVVLIPLVFLFLVSSCRLRFLVS